MDRSLQEAQGEDGSAMSTTGWIIVVVGAVFVPLGIIFLVKFLQNRFGKIAKREDKTVTATLGAIDDNEQSSKLQLPETTARISTPLKTFRQIQKLPVHQDEGE